MSPSTVRTPVNLERSSPLSVILNGASRSDAQSKGVRSIPRFAFALVAFLAALLSAGFGAVRADTIVYTYPGLPGPVANCQWFDDNINDRSIDAIIRQTDLIYNRLALPAGENVAITQTATSAAGAQLVAFNVNRRLLCADSSAFHAEPTPTPSPTPSP